MNPVTKREVEVRLATRDDRPGADGSFSAVMASAPLGLRRDESLVLGGGRRGHHKQVLVSWSVGQLIYELVTQWPGLLSRPYSFFRPSSLVVRG